MYIIIITKPLEMQFGDVYTVICSWLTLKYQ